MIIPSRKTTEKAETASKKEKRFTSYLFKYTSDLLRKEKSEKLSCSKTKVVEYLDLEYLEENNLKTLGTYKSPSNQPYSLTRVTSREKSTRSREKCKG